MAEPRDEPSMFVGEIPPPDPIEGLSVRVERRPDLTGRWFVVDNTGHVLAQNISGTREGAWEEARAWLHVWIVEEARNPASETRSAREVLGEEERDHP